MGNYNGPASPIAGGGGVSRLPTLKVRIYPLIADLQWRPRLEKADSLRLPLSPRTDASLETLRTSHRCWIAGGWILGCSYSRRGDEDDAREGEDGCSNLEEEEIL